MNITIRKYQESDLNSVNDILKESFDITKTNFKNDNYQELVAISDKKPVGYLLLTKVYNPIKQIYYFIIDYICVSSSYRKLGIGKKLLDYVDILAKEEDISYITLTSNYKRIAAHKLYTKCGYIKRESNIFKKEIN